MITFRHAIAADVNGIARVHVDTWRTAYKGIMPSERLANLSYERSAHQWAQSLQSSRSFTTVAVNGEDVVGFVASGPERNNMADYDCEIYALYVLAAHQKQGIGRELIRSAAKELQDRGYQTMLIWVLEDNVTGRHFYERMGGELVEKKMYYPIGDTKLTEVGYGYQLSQLNQ